MRNFPSSNTAMSFSKTDSDVITRLRFPLACLIVLLHAQIIEPEFRPIVADSGFAYALKILLSEGICRIAVPSFFLISGYLFFINLEKWDKSIWIGKMKRRVHTLLIPYILWNLVGIAYVCITPYVGVMTENPESLISVFQERGWLRLFWDSNRIIEQWNPPGVNLLGVTMHNGMPANGPLWFIRDLIVVNLFSPVIYALVKYTKYYGVGILGILFLLNIGIPLEGFSIIAFFFYSTGALLAVSEKGLVATFSKVKTSSYIGSVALLTLLVLVFGHHWSEQYILRLFQLFGVVAGVNFAHRLLHNDSLGSRLADSSFFLYASHLMVLNAVAFLLFKAVPSTNQLLLAAKYLLSTAITIVLCVGVYQIMKKICPGFLSFICGNRRTS